MARILKEIIAASYKIGIRTDAVTKMIENTRKSMVVDSHMTFASKPPDDVVIEWHLATKDVNMFYMNYYSEHVGGIYETTEEAIKAWHNG